MKERQSRSICFYQVATHLGGAERSTLSLLKGLRERSHGVYLPWVLLPKTDGPLVDELKKASIPYEALPMPEEFFKMSRAAPGVAMRQSLASAPWMAVYLAEAFELMRLRQPELIHTVGIKCHALGATLGRMIKKPVLWHLRDILGRGPTLWTLRAIHAAPFSNVHLVANSKATGEAFHSARNAVPIVHNGLNEKQYRPRPHRDFHERMGIPEDTPLVGIMGVLARWKGQVEFLQMAKRLVKKGTRAAFIILGDEIYDTVGEKGFADTLKAQAQELGLGKHVYFAGYQKDPAYAMNGIDLLVHASIKPEPFGRVVVEAMACQVPVVASADGGILEIIDDEKTGLLFPPGNVQVMADQVERLLKDPQLRKQLAQKAYSEFLKRFTENQHVDQMIKLYDQLISQRD